MEKLPFTTTRTEVNLDRNFLGEMRTRIIEGEYLFNPLVGPLPGDKVEREW